MNYNYKCLNLYLSEKTTKSVSHILLANLSLGNGMLLFSSRQINEHKVMVIFTCSDLSLLETGIQISWCQTRARVCTKCIDYYTIKMQCYFYKKMPKNFHYYARMICYIVHFKYSLYEMCIRDRPFAVQHNILIITNWRLQCELVATLFICYKLTLPTGGVCNSSAHNTKYK